MTKHFFFVIMGDKKLNAFMKAADIFEAGKVLGEKYSISIDRDDSPFEGSALIENIRNAFDVNGCIVSFVMLMDGGKTIPYWNKDVRAISNGNNWYMLHEFLKTEYPWLKITINEQCYITDIAL